MDLDDLFDDAGSADSDGIDALVAELEESTQHANSESRPLKPKKVETRGRKLGTSTFKDVSAALLASKSDADSQMPDLVDPSTQPGTIQYARACRSQQKQSALSALETSVLPPQPDGGTSDNALLVALTNFLARLNCSELTHLQKCMLNACSYSLLNQSQDVRSESAIMSMLHTLVLSKRGSHEIASTSSGLKKYTIECMRVACAALHMNGLLWHAMLTHATSVHEGPESGGLKGVLFIRKFRYDETPLKNRVKTWNATLAQHEMDISDHTKLMQVEFSIWALFQKIETGKFVEVDKFQHPNLYLHVGYVNYLTWKMTVLPLYEVEDFMLQNPVPGTQLLQTLGLGLAEPTTADLNLCSDEFQLSVHFFQKNICFKFPYTVQLLEIESSYETMLPGESFRSGYVNVKKFDRDVESARDVFVWQGSELELAANKKKRKQSSTTTRPRSKSSGGAARASNRKTRGRQGGNDDNDSDNFPGDFADVEDN